MRVLLDTCVTIDALQSREPFYEETQEIFLAAANRRFDGFLTAKAATDIYYLTHRITHSDKETRQILSTLLNLFDLIDTAGMDCRRAISSDMSDFEDAVMAESALRSGMDCIVTRNGRDYRLSPVPICTPGELLEKIRPEEESTEDSNST